MDVRLPDGTVLRGVPDGTTRDQLAAKLTGNGMKVPPEWMGSAGADNGGMLDKIKGAGEALLSAGTGAVGQIAGGAVAIGNAFLPSNYGTQEGAQRAQEAGGRVAQAMTYQPRSETGQSILQDVGSAFDESKLAGLVPTEAIMAGGLAPAAATSAAARVRSVAGQARKVLVDASENRQAARLATQAEVSSHAETVKQAMQSGYRVTPRQANPNSTTSNLVEGASGSAKMEKLASIKNQGNTNRLIREDLGLKAGQKITDDSIDGIIKGEGGSYKAVKDSGTPLKATPEYQKAISSLGGDFESANVELPGLIDNPKIDALKKALSVNDMTPTTAVEAVKYLRSEATKNLKAGFLDPEKGAVGTAQRRAANAIDDMIESNLEGAGKKQLADAYRTSRQKIAKAYDIKASLNDTTGNIDALYLAKLLDKGKPLSGNTEKVARFAKAFSGSARNVDNMKDATNFSLADVAMGGAGHLVTGNIAGLAAIAARPATRSLALSKVGQRVISP